jgi:hypothetical protein
MGKIKLTPEEFKAILNSEIGQDLLIVGAFIIDKTKTEVDNNVVSSISDYNAIVSDYLGKMDELNPEAKEALQAVVRLGQKIAKETDWTWDDFVLNMAAKVTGANKK